MAEHGKIRWEDHDDGHDYWFQSECGRFETRLDPVYGYHTLHHAGDCDSLGEAATMTELTKIANGLVEAETA